MVSILPRIVIDVLVFIVYVSAGSIMVRNYHRKSTRGSYSVETVQKAIYATFNHGFSVNKASVVCGIPRTTLIRWLKSSKVTTILGRFSHVFTENLKMNLLCTQLKC